MLARWQTLGFLSLWEYACSTGYGPRKRSWHLELTARCNDVQCYLHGTIIVVVGNDDLEQMLTPYLTLCKKVYGYQSCCVGYVRGTLCTEPLTKLTTIWLDNVMDNDPWEM